MPVSDDILREVFLWAVLDAAKNAQEDAADPYLAVMDTASSFTDSLRTKNPHIPWVVSQVSRHWRYIALQSPQTWSYLHVNLDAYKSGNCAHITERLKLFSARSKGELLHVYFVTTMAHLDYDTSSILSILERSTDRWRTLVTSVGPKMFNDFYHHGCRFPALEAIHVTRGAFMQGSDNWPGGQTPVFKNCPRLRRLSCKSLEPAFDFPWASLEDISTDDLFFVPKAAECLVDARRLRCLDMPASHNTGVPKNLMGPGKWTLASLRELTLRESEPGALATFFGKLTLPCLDILRVWFKKDVQRLSFEGGVAKPSILHVAYSGDDTALEGIIKEARFLLQKVVVRPQNTSPAPYWSKLKEMGLDGMKVTCGRLRELDLGDYLPPAGDMDIDQEETGPSVPEFPPRPFPKFPV